MRRALACAFLTYFLYLSAVSSGMAAVTGLKRVASGLASPIYATHAPNDPTRLFILERGTPVDNNPSNSTANIRILDLTTGNMLPTPFLTITGLDVNGEGGLLGMAFHPDYQNNGKFYLNVTAGDSVGGTVFSTYIREYATTSNPNVADGSTFDTILRVGQPANNHNGGWIDFSPNDGYLYVALGDGGGSDDNDSGHTAGTGNAQDTSDNLLGKMLRLDVNGDDDFPDDDERKYKIPADNPFVGVDGDDEIWAYGLRNPFRNSFDRQTGDLWIGDVGQNTLEEIDFQKGDSDGGENYGWRLREGSMPTPSGGVGVGGDKPPGNVDPIYEYGHGGGNFQGNAVVGGFVYRGPDPTLQGKYFFADEVSNHRWMRDPNTNVVTNVDALLSPDLGSFSNPAAFGEDAVGNMYIVSYGSGNVYRIATSQLLVGDYNADGEVDDADYGVWKTRFGQSAGAALAADGNGDGRVNAADYTVWRNNFGASVHNAGAGSGGVAAPEPAILVMLGQLVAVALLFGRGRDRL